jgi:hypothetical protein
MLATEETFWETESALEKVSLKAALLSLTSLVL